MLWAALAVDHILNTSSVVAAAPILSPRQQTILLQIEDPTFFTHHGLSLTDGQGATTISSALVRDALLVNGDLPGIKGVLQSFYRAVFACCKRVDFGRDVMALPLDAKVSKPVQLDLYTRLVYMGSMNGLQVRGLEQAAQLYFTKPLAQLSEADFISLVAMIKAPNQYHPVNNPQAFALRRERVASVVAGTCQPSGWFDTSYEHCKTGAQ